VSLLMDALKKAEQAKRQGQETADEAAAPALGDSLALEPLLSPPPAPAAADPGPASTPEVQPHLEMMDEEFMDQMRRSIATKPGVATAAKPLVAADAPPSLAAPAVVAPKRPSAAPPQAEQAAAKNVFTAKQLAPATSKKAFLITVSVVTLIAVLGIGGYFWFQMQPKSGYAPTAAIQAPRPTPPIAIAPQQVSPPTQPSVSAPAAPVAGPSAPAEKPVPAIIAADNAAKAPREPDSPIRITTSKLKLNPGLTKAYDALNSGNLSVAQNAYSTVLKSEPKNNDALMGMAAAAVRLGHFDEAEEYYLRAVEADPKNAVAQAGLIGLRGQVDPANSESRLKSLIAAQPDQPFLQFALGNIYVADGRWNEAQQAFFKAFTADPDHPDYLFNLAVSLDHLRQSKLAAQYYNQALAAAEHRPASFDKAQTVTRLRELQP